LGCGDWRAGGLRSHRDTCCGRVLARGVCVRGQLRGSGGVSTECGAMTSSCRTIKTRQLLSSPSQGSACVIVDLCSFVPSIRWSTAEELSLRNCWNRLESVTHRLPWEQSCHGARDGGNLARCGGGERHAGAQRGRKARLHRRAGFAAAGAQEDAPNHAARRRSSHAGLPMRRARSSRRSTHSKRRILPPRPALTTRLSWPPSAMTWAISWPRPALS